MAYIEPKTNWVAGNAPGPSDFNRIEGNTKQNHDDVVAANADIISANAAIANEVAARIADVNAEVAARIADVNAEESARIAAVSAEASTRSSADAIRLTNNSLGSRTVSSASIPPSSSYTIPSGIYYVSPANSIIQVQGSDGTWRDINNGLCVSDGSHVRAYNPSAGSSAGVLLIRIL